MSGLLGLLGAAVGVGLGAWISEGRARRRDLALLRALGWPIAITATTAPTIAEVNYDPI